MKWLSIAVFLLSCLHVLSSQEGLASWYGGKFQGRRTASGEIFDSNKLTAAHKTLPFGTQVKVINLANGKSTVVRINDRGPFVKGRIIDLSRAAAAEIGMTGKGVVLVRLEVIESSAPERRYTIQLGAYSEIDNAQRLMKRLEEEGISPSMEAAENGITRIIIKNITDKNLKTTRERLYRLGFKDFLIRQDRS